MKSIYKFFVTILPSEPVSAHCDVPCGIYDPRAAQIAAATVLKMVQIITGIDQSNKSIKDRNTLIRAIMTKEEHAQKCKEELLILWTDYFKPEHLEKFPNLHETFWKAAKLCSKNKQDVSEELAQQLVDAVHEISHIFEESKAK
jgi:nickel superoxide dismutase